MRAGELNTDIKINPMGGSKFDADGGSLFKAGLHTDRLPENALIM